MRSSSVPGTDAGSFAPAGIGMFNAVRGMLGVSFRSAISILQSLAPLFAQAEQRKRDRSILRFTDRLDQRLFGRPVPYHREVRRKRGNGLFRSHHRRNSAMRFVGFFSSGIGTLQSHDNVARLNAVLAAC